MTRELRKIVPIVLRLGAIMLLTVALVRETPAPGLTGVSLVVTLLTGALALTMLALLLLSLPFPSGPREGSREGSQKQIGRQYWTPWWQTLLPRHRMSERATMAALSVAVVLSIILNSISLSGATIACLLVCVSLAVSRLRLRQAITIAVLAVAGIVTAGEISGAPEAGLPLILSTCLVFLITYAARQRKAARTAEAREAVLAERARIAREIHDILAHSLSAQLVHLEGAKLLLRAERTSEALERVTHARDLAKSGLEEARRAVSALREDPPDLPVALRTLAKDFETTAHQPCALHISGPEHRLPPETELALVRTAQEALTNVRRHAPGSPATVELEFDPSWCDLRVSNPASPEEGSPGGGYGLVGMRERAELIGGTLSAGERDGGFLVHLRVPA